MRDPISKLIDLIPTLIGQLSVAWRRVVALGVFTAVLVGVACWLIEWRLSRGVPTTILTGSLSIVLDIKLMVFGIAAVVVILSWLGTLLYALYRRN